MVQRFIPAVETAGERAVVWIDGETTHAVRKAPRFTGQDESVSGALPVTDAERERVERALSAVAGGEGAMRDLLYARADLVDDDGTLRISELELIEPSLFLKQSPAALERLVDAIARM